jgi:tRNA(Ile2)-agmatinylcytidine synthase
MQIFYLGIDDTDSVSGGCTTYFALEALSILKGWTACGYPRLVRLNPNIPWKTRGNGAIALRLLPDDAVKSIENKVRIQIGSINNKPVWGYQFDGVPEHGLSSGEQERDLLGELLDSVSAMVEENSMLDDAKTNPGIVVGTSKIDEELYLRAVSELVELADVEAILNNSGFLYRGFKNRRGLIGATASLAWIPKIKERGGCPGRTYELIAYRERARWGTARQWDFRSAGMLDEHIPFSFDNYDRVNDIARIAPNTPCPVFYGVRGTGVDGLQKSLEIVRTTEPVDRWVIFETNHATDDHLRKSVVSEFEPYRSVSVEGTVTKGAYTERGGHTFIEMADVDGAAFVCAAYEPTKEFRDVVRALSPGDRAMASGGLRTDENNKALPTINLEKLNVLELAELTEKIGNPRCAGCGKPMKSIGAGQGFRCRACGNTAKETEAEYKVVTRKIKRGWYEVPVCARRHLSCPLSLLNEEKRY